MKSVLAFIGGIIIGAGATYIHQKKQYEKQINDEFREAREYKKKQKHDKSQENKEVIEEAPMEHSNEEFDADLERVRDLVYNQHYGKPNEPIEDEPGKPYIVTPDEFGTIAGFDAISFYYHPNGVISNDDHNEVDNIEEMLGMSIEEIEKQFGVYEDDSVYIRNMPLQTDFEILREEEDYE